MAHNRKKPVHGPNHAPATPSPRARPMYNVMTPEKAEMILEVIGDGGTIRDAAAMAMISSKVIRNLAAQDIIFAGHMARAQAECKMHHIRRLKAGERQWQSSAWFLERRWPREFCLGESSSDEERVIYTRRIARNHPDKVPVEVPLSKAVNPGDQVGEIPDQPEAMTPQPGDEEYDLE